MFASNSRYHNRSPTLWRSPYERAIATSTPLPSTASLYLIIVGEPADIIVENELQVGEGIWASGVARSRLWITSKLWNSDHRPAEARAAIEKSISDLGVEYLDLYLVHWPVAFVPGGGTELDNETSILDTWRTMESLVEANLTRYIGISNFAPADVQAILDMCIICPYAHEFETHPYLQQRDFVEFHENKGIKVIAYSPLANTNPTYDSGIPGIAEDPFWVDLGRKYSTTVPTLALVWAGLRGTVAIPKSVREDHIEQNYNSIGFLQGEDMQAIAGQDKKLRMNDPGKAWGVRLFEGLDDPTEPESLAGDAEL